MNPPVAMHLGADDELGAQYGAAAARDADTDSGSVMPAAADDAGEQQQPSYLISQRGATVASDSSADKYGAPTSRPESMTGDSEGDASSANPRRRPLNGDNAAATCSYSESESDEDKTHPQQQQQQQADASAAAAAAASAATTTPPIDLKKRAHADGAAEIGAADGSSDFNQRERTLCPTDSGTHAHHDGDNERLTTSDGGTDHADQHQQAPTTLALNRDQLMISAADELGPHHHSHYSHNQATVVAYEQAAAAAYHTGQWAAHSLNQATHFLHYTTADAVASVAASSQATAQHSANGGRASPADAATAATNSLKSAQQALFHALPDLGPAYEAAVATAGGFVPAVDAGGQHADELLAGSRRGRRESSFMCDFFEQYSHQGGSGGGGGGGVGAAEESDLNSLYFQPTDLNNLHHSYTAATKDHYLRCAPSHHHQPMAAQFLDSFVHHQAAPAESPFADLGKHPQAYNHRSHHHHQVAAAAAAVTVEWRSSHNDNQQLAGTAFINGATHAPTNHHNHEQHQQYFNHQQLHQSHQYFPSANPEARGQSSAVSGPGQQQQPESHHHQHHASSRNNMDAPYVAERRSDDDERDGTATTAPTPAVQSPPDQQGDTGRVSAGFSVPHTSANSIDTSTTEPTAIHQNYNSQIAGNQTHESFPYQHQHQHHHHQHSFDHNHNQRVYVDLNNNYRDNAGIVNNDDGCLQELAPPNNNVNVNATTTATATTTNYNIAQQSNQAGGNFKGVLTDATTSVNHQTFSQHQHHYTVHSAHQPLRHNAAKYDLGGQLIEYRPISRDSRFHHQQYGGAGILEPVVAAVAAAGFVASGDPYAQQLQHPNYSHHQPQQNSPMIFDEMNQQHHQFRSHQSDSSACEMELDETAGKTYHLLDSSHLHSDPFHEAVAQYTDQHQLAVDSSLYKSSLLELRHQSAVQCGGGQLLGQSDNLNGPEMGAAGGNIPRVSQLYDPSAEISSCLIPDSQDTNSNDGFSNSSVSGCGGGGGGSSRVGWQKSTGCGGSGRVTAIVGTGQRCTPETIEKLRVFLERRRQIREAQQQQQQQQLRPTDSSSSRSGSPQSVADSEDDSQCSAPGAVVGRRTRRQHQSVAYLPTGRGCSGAVGGNLKSRMSAATGAANTRARSSSSSSVTVGNERRLTAYGRTITRKGSLQSEVASNVQLQTSVKSRQLRSRSVVLPSDSPPAEPHQPANPLAASTTTTTTDTHLTGYGIETRASKRRRHIDSPNSASSCSPCSATVPSTMAATHCETSNQMQTQLQRQPIK